jgi:hypothetical protein
VEAQDPMGSRKQSTPNHPSIHGPSLAYSSPSGSMTPLPQAAKKTSDHPAISLI